MIDSIFHDIDDEDEVELIKIVPVTSNMDEFPDKMYWFKFSNDVWVVLGMDEEALPALGTKMIMVFPNETEVWVHWPTTWRSHSVYPVKFQRGKFCV